MLVFTIGMLCLHVRPFHKEGQEAGKLDAFPSSPHCSACSLRENSADFVPGH